MQNPTQNTIAPIQLSRRLDQLHLTHLLTPRGRQIDPDLASFGMLVVAQNQFHRLWVDIRMSLGPKSDSFLPSRAAGRSYISILS